MDRTVIELDTATINKIAAGEVIERPASVVKELVENSIDANSSTIEINIHEGGKKLIEVIDDGAGMTHEDAVLAIKRHTTSKLKTAADLFDIRSLGFRGEALASIVSVSMVEIVTRPRGAELGTKLIIEGGKITLDTQISAPIGTRISVKNLFFNVPVRKKFLKNISTELKHITEIITKLALSNPQISITLKHEGKTLISAPKGDLLTNIATIFGKNMAKGALQVSKSEDGYYLDGYILKPEFARKSKDYLYLFVNHRPIKNKLITDAILAGYGTTIPHGSYPIVFLNFNLPADNVDVNIHPTKREVKFAQESKVFSLFERTIKETIEQSKLEIFERIKQPKIQPTLLEGIKKQKNQGISQTSPTIKTTVKPRTLGGKYEVPFSIRKTRSPTLQGFIPSEIDDKESLVYEEREEQKGEIRVLGIIRNTYIVAETEKGLLLCDQHAAAEKVNYIKYLRQIRNKKVPQQKLLSPVVVNLKPSELSEIEEIKEKLEGLGFLIEEFGTSEVIVRGVPSILGKIISPEIVSDVIDILKNHAEEIKEKVALEKLNFVKDIVALTSCRRSIKAGDKISKVEGEKLIEELLTQEDPWTCPHGRPTMVILGEDYLEELFGRDYK
ncbi:MAG: DNA mismatch repair endonuclease MutL [Candidatus Heimdallarchaeaceae archaeon]